MSIFKKKEAPVFDRYGNSNAHLERAEKVIPLGAQTFSKSHTQFPVPCSPLYLESGKGARVWDVDGHEYIDLICGLLPVNLGHCDPDVDRAISKQLKSGISFSLSTTLEAELAEMLVDLIPCADAVRFGKNGTDATSATIRLARAFTGKDHVIAIGYHGWQDWYVGATTRNLGVPEAVQKLTTKLPYNDLNIIKETIKKQKKNVAAIIMEPVSAIEPEEGYLEAIREIATEENIVLIFDEVITGFRAHIGGAQALYGVTPDLAAFGKGMGNGMPISAVVGRADIMSLMSDIFYSGTFGGEALSLAAAIATIKKMQRENVVEHLWGIGQSLADGAQKVAQECHMQDILSLSGIAPWKILTFKDHKTAKKEEIKTRFMIEMLERGILMAGSHNICFAHEPKHVHKILRAYKETLSVIHSDLETGALQDNLKAPAIYPVFQVRS